MKQIFNYIQIGLVYKPIIPITLKCHNIEFNYLALIDSGADFNIFHQDLAKILKINFSKQKRLFTFGGINAGTKGKAFFADVELGLGDNFIKTPTAFSDNISENGYGILGQQGFFNYYKVSFDYALKYIKIE